MQQNCSRGWIEVITGPMFSGSWRSDLAGRSGGSDREAARRSVSSLTWMFAITARRSLRIAQDAGRDDGGDVEALKAVLFPVI